jgi:hypothetical protein
MPDGGAAVLRVRQDDDIHRTQEDSTDADVRTSRHP